MIKDYSKRIPPGFIHLLSLLLLGSAVSLSYGDGAPKEETIAYKLAVMQLNEDNPENLLLKKTTVPPPALLTEFQWIMDSLTSRCLNPENAIADTIVENWKALNKAGKSMTLLQTAHELANVATNIQRSDNKKVNFRMTSRYWLKNKLGEAAKTATNKGIF